MATADAQHIWNKVPSSQILNKMIFTATAYGNLQLKRRPLCFFSCHNDKKKPYDGLRFIGKGKKKKGSNIPQKDSKVHRVVQATNDLLEH